MPKNGAIPDFHKSNPNPRRKNTLRPKVPGGEGREGVCRTRYILTLYFHINLILQL